jgi:hypothetical protein
MKGGLDIAVADRTAAVAADLRAGLAPLLALLAGVPPRPVRLTQGIGLDKSLASRLVQAIRCDDDLEFLHTVPSPGGLRILLDRAHGQVDTSLLRDFEPAVHRFESLLDTLPGGRQTLDAQMGEASVSIRERREQMARQASFKAQSFLFGHTCDTLTTALFVLPSASSGCIDFIEVHRRIGLQRVTPSVMLPLLSVHTGAGADADAPCMLPLDGCDGFLVPPACSRPLPVLSLVQEGAMRSFVLGPDAGTLMPARITTAYRIQRADSVAQDKAWNTLRNYMLHTPCRTLVRDVYLAAGLWPDALPQIGFYLPGPSGTGVVDIEPGLPHLRRVNLTARIEQLPPGARGFELDGVPDQRTALAHTLALAGVDPAEYRGWRCRMTYPVPLIEMQVAMRFAAR